MVDVKDGLPYGDGVGPFSVTGNPDVELEDAEPIDIPLEGIEVELVPGQNSAELYTEIHRPGATSEKNVFAIVYVDDDLNVCVMNYDGSQNVIIFPSEPIQGNSQSPTKPIGKLDRPFSPVFFGGIGSFVSRYTHCSLAVTGFGNMDGRKYVRVNVRHVGGKNGTFYRRGGSIHSKTGTYVSSEFSESEKTPIPEDFNPRHFTQPGEEHEVPAERNKIPCVYKICRPSDGQLLASVRAVTGGDEVYVSFVNVYGEPRLDWVTFESGQDIVVDPKSVPEKKSKIDAAQGTTRRSLSETFRGAFGFLPWGKSETEGAGSGNRGKIVLSLSNAASGGKRFVIKNKGQVPFDCEISTH